jgi:hypothetical protein
MIKMINNEKYLRRKEDKIIEEVGNCSIINKITGKKYFFTAGDGKNDCFSLFRDVIKQLYNNQCKNEELQNDFHQFGFSNMNFEINKIPDSIKGKKFFKLF